MVNVRQTGGSPLGRGEGLLAGLGPHLALGRVLETQPEAPGELRVQAVSGSGRGVLGFGGAAELVVDAQGFFELVFEDDDAAGGLDGGALVDEFAGARRDAQLVAGEAAVAALGAQGGDQAASPRARRKPGVVPIISAARPMV